MVLRRSYDDFLEQLRTASQRLLLLDYDGTLAPFNTDRLAAYPYPELKPLLEQLQFARNTRVVIISGRDVRDLVRLLELPRRPEMWGVHGLQRLMPDGTMQNAYLNEQSLKTLRMASLWIKDSQLSEHAEYKQGAVAIHWRGATEQAIEKIRTDAYRVLGPIACKGNLLLSEFDGGMELRLRGFSKGMVVRTLLNEVDESAAVAYLGDDLTDEDAFRALNGRGLTILARPTYRNTAARVWLQPPTDVADFFRNWLNTCEEDKNAELRDHDRIQPAAGHHLAS